MSRQAIGHRAECDLRGILEARGEYVVRSASSKVLDLISIPPTGGAYGIEVKSTQEDRFYLMSNAYTVAQFTHHLMLAERMPVYYAVQFRVGNAKTWEKWAVKDGMTTVLRKGSGETV